MSGKSNDQGRAYEFAYLNILFEEISSTRLAKIVKNSSYFAAAKAWNTLSDSDKVIYRTSALAGASVVFDLEPLIFEGDGEELELRIQPDSKGKDGDARDLLITRRGVEWEIGLSVKHNHFAVKHSRLSKSLDFGDKWYGIKCSCSYWEDVYPIFEYLDCEKQKGSKWSDLINKRR
ncbi:HaeIII family restriction endonuclease [Canibacter sp. lx-72]|uniref:HaeIII family restriction endonuclease n=1 Tax=Canibacter zhuwentaonis TaxID=2837491 RepID=UPI001BDBCA4F|nr:HaeIII family restriction endonuclease [Canibacter zhuwentaonis]MBT1018366.1 HaeIII family restriction endonuclease [Canibacter zhuwentaonis]